MNRQQSYALGMQGIWRIFGHADMHGGHQPELKIHLVWPTSQHAPKASKRAVVNILPVSFGACDMAG